MMTFKVLWLTFQQIKVVEDGTNVRLVLTKKDLN